MVGCVSVSPYLSIGELDLTQKKIFTSPELRFESDHRVCIVLKDDDLKKLNPSDLVALRRASYSVQPKDGLSLYSLEQSNPEGWPKNLEFLFEVYGAGNARVIVDFSDVTIPVTKFRIAVLKSSQQLKDPRIRFDRY
jgi:hypothetical protein